MSFLRKAGWSQAFSQGSKNDRLGAVLYTSKVVPTSRAMSPRTLLTAASRPSMAPAGLLAVRPAIAPLSTTSPGSAIQGKLTTMVPAVSPKLQPLMDKLHAVMIKERRPLGLLGINSTTNAGALCGHFSFAILTAAYLETDVLTLRVLVLSGSTLNILFNLFRVVGPPVWIPIKWNLGFLALNAVMVLLLLMEIEEAEELAKDPEQARIYREIFMPVQLSPVHFLRLMDVAERRVMLKGNDLNQEGRPHAEVFLIVEGTAEVKSEGVAVSHLEPGGFVGSMAFNRFIKKTASTSSDGHYVYKEGGMFRKAWEAILYQLRREGSVVGEVAQTVIGDGKLKRRDTSEMERSHNTTTATSDVVAYVWDMHILREFVKRRPLIGASLQKAISVDLVRKVDQSRDHKEHYRQLLAEALDGGRVTSTERKNLQRYRKVHKISLAEHAERLKEHKWTEEEFQAGFQEGVFTKDMSENFLEYTALLGNELSKGEVKTETKSKLRRFRSQAGIDAQEHLIALEKQGWTADEYELGGKAKSWLGDRFDGGGGMPADFDQTSDTNESTDNGFGIQEEAASAEKERYRFLVMEALRGGVLLPEKREALGRYRKMHNISPTEHKAALKEQGWEEHEFEAGFHQKIASTFFQQYAALMERELSKGEVKPSVKSNLRNFRTRLNIDAQDHLLAVEKQGWTADEYEAGFKRENDKGKNSSSSSSNNNDGDQDADADNGNDNDNDNDNDNSAHNGNSGGSNDGGNSNVDDKGTEPSSQ